MYDGTVGLCEKVEGLGFSDGKNDDGAGVLGVVNDPLGLS